MSLENFVANMEREFCDVKQKIMRENNAKKRAHLVVRLRKIEIAMNKARALIRPAVQICGTTQERPV